MFHRDINKPLIILIKPRTISFLSQLIRQQSIQIFLIFKLIVRLTDF